MICKSTYNLKTVFRHSLTTNPLKVRGIMLLIVGRSAHTVSDLLRKSPSAFFPIRSFRMYALYSSTVPASFRDRSFVPRLTIVVQRNVGFAGLLGGIFLHFCKPRHCISHRNIAMERGCRLFDILRTFVPVPNRYCVVKWSSLYIGTYTNLKCYSFLTFLLGR